MKPCGKIIHPDRAAAEIHRWQLRRAGGNPDLNVYACSRCGGFHVGHSQVRFRARIRAALRP